MESESNDERIALKTEIRKMKTFCIMNQLQSRTSVSHGLIVSGANFYHILTELRVPDSGQKQKGCHLHAFLYFMPNTGTRFVTGVRVLSTFSWVRNQAQSRFLQISVPWLRSSAIGAVFACILTWWLSIVTVNLLTCDNVNVELGSRCGDVQPPFCRWHRAHS